MEKIGGGKCMILFRFLLGYHGSGGRVSISSRLTYVLKEVCLLNIKLGFTLYGDFLKNPKYLTRVLLKTPSIYRGFLKPQVYHFLLEVIIPPSKKSQLKLYFFVVL